MENWEDIVMPRTLRDYATPFVEGVYNDINRPSIQINNFELQPSINQLMQNSKFGGSLIPLDTMHYMGPKINFPDFNTYNLGWNNYSNFLWNKIQNNQPRNWSNNALEQRPNYPPKFNSQVQNEDKILSLEDVVLNLGNQIQDNAIALRNIEMQMGASLKNLEMQIEQLASSLSNISQNTLPLPSNIEINPEDNCKEKCHDVELMSGAKLNEIGRKLDEENEKASPNDQGLEDIDHKMNLSNTIENFIERPPPPFPHNMIKDILIPIDFVELNIKENGEVPIIQEIPFIVTERALIDIKRGELNMGLQDNQVTFSVTISMKCLSENHEIYLRVDFLENYVKKEMEKNWNKNSLKQVSTNSKINKSDNEYIIFLDKTHKVLKENYKIN